jgi:hypothetical protein
VHVAAPAFEVWLDVERARRLAHELGLTLEAGVRDTTPSNTPS